jgi:hypothetical protein
MTPLLSKTNLKKQLDGKNPKLVGSIGSCKLLSKNNHPFLEIVNQ